jgi:hypothetical protein
MRLFLAILALTGVTGSLAAAAAPLPRPRPTLAPAPQTARVVPRPPGQTGCDQRLAPMADFVPRPRLIGPGGCGARDMVEVRAVLMPDKRRIAIAPAALLRCPMAESLVAWVRDEVAPRIAKSGGVLRGIENYDSYECRTRNRVPGAKLSEHAHGDAIDLRSFTLADGRRIVLADPHGERTLREALRDSACRRFTTVLGPGADSYHRTHVHLDDRERRGGYRICEWEVGAPAQLPPAKSVVPLPRPRPGPASVPLRRRTSHHGPTF